MLILRAVKGLQGHKCTSITPTSAHACEQLCCLSNVQSKPRQRLQCDLSCSPCDALRTRDWASLRELDRGLTHQLLYDWLMRRVLNHPVMTGLMGQVKWARVGVRCYVAVAALPAQRGPLQDNFQ